MVDEKKSICVYMVVVMVVVKVFVGVGKQIAEEQPKGTLTSIYRSFEYITLPSRRI